MCRKHKKNYSTAAAGTRIADAKGLPTGSKVRVLDPSTGSGQAWTTTLTGYDPHKRPVWTASKNTYLGTTDFVETKLNFIGWAEEVKNIHQKTGQADLVVIEKFTYDHAGKVLVQTHQTNSNPAQRIADNTYDRLGQLKKKNVGGTTLQAALQNVDYAYNIRGWLKAINDVNNIGTVDLFAFKLGYNEDTSPLYNGNISLTQWKTRNTDSSLKTYNYTYDALNRILTATDNTAKFNLSGLSYDKNGNIMGLVRQGQTIENPNLALGAGYGPMDNLVYAYDSGNKLLKVTDNANDTYGFKDGVNTGDDFTYDVNGNMLSDANKGITGIVYNHLNLPTQVTMAGQNILYIYDAVGTKLRKTVSGITTDYAGNYVYESGTLQFFNTAEGYVEPNGTGWQYVYQYRDHLGNIRLSYADSNGDGLITATGLGAEIREENNFYPFGLKHKGYNNVATSTNPALKYKYNGVEYEESLGMNLYEMDVRSYDPAIARFTSIDPVTHFDYSTYNAFDNNPVFWADPSGADAINEFGAVTSNSGVIIWGDARSSQFDEQRNNENDGNDNTTSENNSSPPTEFVNEKGETIVKTDDESNQVYVIDNRDYDSFLKDLKVNIKNGKDKSKKENDRLGLKYGNPLEDLFIDWGNNYEYIFGYSCGYGNLGSCANEIGLDPKERAYYSVGYTNGSRDYEKGNINRSNPILKNNVPLYRIIQQFTVIDFISLLSPDPGINRYSTKKEDTRILIEN